MTVVPTEGVDMIEAEVEAAGPGEVRSIISAGLVNRSETHSNMVNKKSNTLSRKCKFSSHFLGSLENPIKSLSNFSVKFTSS